MDLLEEIKSAKKLWREATPLGKIIISVSLFSATASIASLADTIFAWKGFFLDGIEFYRSYVRAVFEWIALPFELHFEFWQLDMICICIILIGGIFRTTASLNVFQIYSLSIPLKLKKYKLLRTVVIFILIFPNVIIGYSIGALSAKKSPEQVIVFLFICSAIFVFGNALWQKHFFIDALQTINRALMNELLHSNKHENSESSKPYEKQLGYKDGDDAKFLRKCKVLLKVGSLNELSDKLRFLRREVESGFRRYLSVPIIALVIVLICGAFNEALTR